MRTSLGLSVATVAGVAVGFAIIGTAAAQDYPRLVGEVEAELRYDYVYDADVGRDQGSARYIQDSSPTIELGIAIESAPRWSIQSGLILEPVRTPARDRSFDDLGVFVEQLNLRYGRDPHSLFAGKFNLAFGIAWDVAPGVYGTDFAKDYEITEQLGLGATYLLETERFGNLEFEGSIFVADTSAMSKSWATRPLRSDANVERAHGLDRADGGLANTGRLDNFVLAVTGENAASLPGFSWHAGYLLRQAGRTETADERGGVAGLTHAFAANDDVVVSLLGEYAYIRDFGGVDQIARYMTLGGNLAWESGWHASVVFSRRDLDPAPGFDDDRRKRLYTGTIGYAFEAGPLEGATASIGWKTERAGTSDANTVGILIAYDYDFALSRRNK